MALETVRSRAQCLYTPAQVDAAYDRMALELTATLADSNPLFLCVLVGGLVPTAGIIRRCEFPAQLDYVHATRYRSGTRGGELEWRARPRQPLAGRTVVVVDDILDHGITLAAIVQMCREEGAREVVSAVLVRKRLQAPGKQVMRADIVGLEVDDRYVFGCGMDYHEHFRHLPGIYAVADSADE